MANRGGRAGFLLGSAALRSAATAETAAAEGLSLAHGGDGRVRAGADTLGYRARTWSTYALRRQASSPSLISSTFSAFFSPECERLNEPAKTVSSATTIFACMKLCNDPAGCQASERLPAN